MDNRGVAPDILISQVRNTIPFVFDDQAAWLARAPFLKPLLEPATSHSDAEYYGICLAAHYATVSSFVPTDVDNQIRHRLWQPATGAALEQMVALVLESRQWDYRPLSARWIVSPATGRKLGGHAGEWFSTAVGAFAATRRKAPPLSETVAVELRDEVTLEAAIFSELVKARDGIGALVAATIIAHNLGDLERVAEMWGLKGHAEFDFGQRTNRVLAAACELNKLKMAAENHRHFALRKPRCLRRSADFLLPYGPFLDDWGARLARHPGLDIAELGEITEALIEGLERTPGAIGYTRALAGLESAVRGGPQALHGQLPSREVRKLKAGTLRTQIAQPREAFERQWAQFALNWCKTALR